MTGVQAENSTLSHRFAMQEKLESPSKEELMDTKSVQDQNMDFEIHVTKTIGQNRVIA